MTAADIPAIDRARAFRLGPPNRGLGLLEARAPFEWASLLAALPALMTLPRGDGRDVVVIPGFGADDTSTWPLRTFLNGIGYQAQPCDLGYISDPEQAAEQLQQRLIGASSDRTYTLIGWSLGGVVARIVAHEQPSLVDEIITLGTPVEGGPKYTRVGDFYAKQRGIDLNVFEEHVHHVNQQGIAAPITVIYSRSDAVVAWRAAIDRYNAHARHFLVESSHIGLGVNPFVYRLIAKTLAADTAQ
ncbi:MAG: hypothetical protein AAF529_00335 [Pseudomonadota bacterium]